MRAFIRLRTLLSTQAELFTKLEELEEKVGEHDAAIQGIVIAIRRLMSSEPRTLQIGFDTEESTN